MCNLLPSDISKKKLFHLYYLFGILEIHHKNDAAKIQKLFYDKLKFPSRKDGKNNNDDLSSNI